MADNYLEYHHTDYRAAKARKEKARLHRQHQYLVAYRKRLAAQQSRDAGAPATPKTDNA